jgi:hypothetical protein
MKERTMNDFLLTLASNDSLGTRLAVCGVAVVIGIILIVTGRTNVKTRTAEESGKARIVNSIFGRSDQYEGKKAVVVG